MQLENYRDLDGRRVQLNERERDEVPGVVENDTRETLAIGGITHPGLRSQEVVNTHQKQFYQSETGQWFVRAPEGKGDKERSIPTSAMLAGMIRAHEPGQLVVDRTRKIQRWLDTAAEEVGDRENNERWRHLVPHGLRRT